MRGLCIKNGGLVFHGTAQAIWLIDSLLYDRKKTFQTFTDDLLTILPKNVSHEIRPTSVSQGFVLIFQIVQKFAENSPRIFQKIIAQEFYQKHFPKFYNFSKFSKNFETILVDMLFQFCLATQSIRQDGTVLPDDQPIKLQESRAG